MLWIYDLPNWLMCLSIVSAFLVLSLGGLWLTRGWVEEHCYDAFEDHNEAVSAFIGTYGVFFGITLGLIAVATWENFEAASAVIDDEAAALATLYRDVSAFPEPVRTHLRGRLHDYVDYVIEKAWAEHRKGHVPKEGLKMARDFEAELVNFEPATLREQVVFQESLDQFNRMVSLRQHRYDAVEEGLPDILWWVVLIGAALNILLVYLVHIKPARTHFLLLALLASFLGLMVFLVAALDHPFRGQFSLEPTPFEHVRGIWRELEEVKPGPG
jgi:hypothetical protein